MADGRNSHARAIEWPRPGVVSVLENLELPEPGPGDVVVDVAVTVTSTGTELARFRSLPNAAVRYPHRPGFMAAGTVAAGTPRFTAGDAVAVRQVPHQSRAVVGHAHVHPIPPGVDALDAALWHLGLIALYGLQRGGYEPGAPVAVVGAGIVGAMVRRIALAMGSSGCLAVATSDAKRWGAAAEAGTRFIALSEGSPDEEAERHLLTIDATGSAESLETSVALTSAAGSVVLLGSPRAELSVLPIRAIQDRGVRVVGAHIGTLKKSAATTEDELTETFFRLLAEGLSFSDLIERRSPDEAGHVYEVAAGEPSFIAAAFDWSGDAVAPAVELSRAAAPSDAVPVRFALVGCGDIGAHNARALDEALDAQLTTVFDPITALAEELAGRYTATAVDSLAAAVSSPDVDVVLVATPHDTHEAVVQAALEAGKHVLLEKPIAADLDSALRIAHMADKSASTVAVLFPMRTDRRFIRAEEAIGASPEGAPTGAVSTYLMRKPEHYFSGGYSKRAQSSWRQSKARAGGGVLIMNVLHHLDAVRALIGREAQTVFAQTAPSLLYPGIEDVVTLIVDFGGALATFVGAGSVFTGQGESIELWNSSLRIALLPEGSVAHANGRREAESDFEPLPRNQSRIDFIAAFATAIRDGTQPLVAVRDALAVQAIVTGAYLSASEGRSVRIPELLDEVRER